MTASESQGPSWGGKRGGARRLWLFVLLSLLLHTPLTPLVALLGLLQFLTPANGPALPAEPPITGIPIDLLETAPGDRPPAPAPPEQPASGRADSLPGDSTPAASSDLDAGAGLDAGAPDASASASVDAGADTPQDAGETTEEPVEAGLGDSGAPDAAAEDAGSIPDPIKLAGAAAQVADPNANVRLFVYTERVRGHPLASTLASIVRELPQWRDFFGPAGVDPINDIDRILVVGPQFRDSSNIIALVQHHVAPAAMRRALDALVKRDPEGRWLRARVPAALARADRAQRVFVMPNPHLVVVAPPSAQRNVLRLRTAQVPAEAGDDIVVAHVNTPWRVFIGYRIPVPKSIKWAKVSVAPLAGGGARAKVLALDESPDLAARDARELEQMLGRVSGIGFGPFRMSFVESIRFQSQSSEIHGEIRVNADQLALIVSWVRQALGIRPPPPTQPSSAPLGSPSIPPLPAPLSSNDLPAPLPAPTSLPSGATSRRSEPSPSNPGPPEPNPPESNPPEPNPSEPSPPEPNPSEPSPPEPNPPEPSPSEPSSPEPSPPPALP